MKILLTGGAGDLGKVLAYRIEKRGDIALRLDIGAYEYTQDDLKNWDKLGSGTTFKKYYEKYYDLAVKYGLDPAAKPTMQDISSTQQLLGYEPHYSLMNVLDDLSKYGERGPSSMNLDI